MPENNPDHFQVQVCSVPLPLPFSLAIHTYFLLSHNGVVDRYEIWWESNKAAAGNLFIYKNFYDDHSIGGRMTFFNSIADPKHFFKTTVISTVTGAVDSAAHKLYETVQASMTTYPGKRIYQLLPGPNSNTYVQWAIDQVPDCGLTLPWNAFGKSYTFGDRIEK